MKKWSVAILLFLSGCGIMGVTNKVSSAEDSFFKRYTISLKKMDRNLRFLGPTVLSGHTIKTFGAHVMYKGNMELENGRALFASLIEQFIKETNGSRALKNYIVPYPLTSNRVEYVLSFWDPDMERPKKPFLAEIRMKDDIVEYLYKQDANEGLETQGIRENYSIIKKTSKK
jgi:hypothetical protein